MRSGARPNNSATWPGAGAAPRHHPRCRPRWHPRRRPCWSCRPAPLADLCPANAERVLARSGIAPDALHAAEARWRAGGDLPATCSSRPLEATNSKFTQFEFKPCSTTPMAPAVPGSRNLPQKDIEARLDEVADFVVGALDKAPRNNRVYIDGHTDDQLVKGGGCVETGARDNVRLSLERADWFRLRLIDALNRGPRYQSVRDRLAARTLHIYPIGVGEREPLDRHTGESDDDYKKRNRRIEVHVAYKQTKNTD